MTRVLRVLAAVVALMLVIAACGSGDDGETTETEATQAATTAATVAATTATTTAERFDAAEPAFTAGDEADALGSGGIDATNVAQVNLGRDIIFTAEVVVGVDDVATASAQASNAVQQLGGFVFGQQTTGGPNATSTITFKIPPENFQAALAALGSVGEVRTQSVTASDVTERVVDLESRIRTAEASVERLTGFLATAGDIDTIAELEAQLLDRETNLEVLRGQLRTVRDAVSLATITVTLREAESNPQMQLQLTAYEDIEDVGASCPGSPDLRVLEGESAVVCFEITNVGDTSLADFTIDDAVLGVTIQNLTHVWGTPDVPLEPGQSLIMATTVTLERTLRPQTRATAVPVNANGEPIDAREVSQTATATLTAQDPGGLPGFSDGLSESWEFLKDLGGLLVLMVGILIPFIWLPFVLYGVWRWRRSRLASLPNPTAETTSVSNE